MPNARHTCFVLSFRYLQDTISRINVKSRLFLLFRTGGTKQRIVVPFAVVCCCAMSSHPAAGVSAMQ